MANSYSVIYKAVADFKSLQKSIAEAQASLTELKKAESSYNKSSVEGATASAAAHKLATRELTKEATAFDKAAASALAYAAAVEAAAKAEGKIGRARPGERTGAPGVAGNGNNSGSRAARAAATSGTTQPPPSALQRAADSEFFRARRDAQNAANKEARDAARAEAKAQAAANRRAESAVQGKTEAAVGKAKPAKAAGAAPTDDELRTRAEERYEQTLRRKAAAEAAKTAVLARHAAIEEGKRVEAAAKAKATDDEADHQDALRVRREKYKAKRDAEAAATALANETPDERRKRKDRERQQANRDRVKAAREDAALATRIEPDRAGPGFVNARIGAIGPTLSDPRRAGQDEADRRTRDNDRLAAEAKHAASDTGKLDEQMKRLGERGARNSSVEKIRKDIEKYNSAARRAKTDTAAIDRELDKLGKSGVGKGALRSLRRDLEGKAAENRKAGGPSLLAPGERRDSAGRLRNERGEFVRETGVAKKVGEGSLGVATGAISGTTGALGGLAGAFGKFASIASLASLIQPLIAALLSLGAGAISLVASLGSLATALVAIGPLAIAGAAGAGALIVGFKGVMDVFKQYGAVTKEVEDGSASVAQAVLSSAKQLVAAEDQLNEAKRSKTRDLVTQAVAEADAEHNIDQAQRASLGAQLDLTQARRDAVRALADMREAVANTALSEQQALIDVRRARLNDQLIKAAPAGTPQAQLDRDQSTLDVAKAEQNLVDVQREKLNGALALATAEAKGIEQDQAVVAGRQAVADADYAQLKATKDLQRVQTENFEQQRTGMRAVAAGLQAVADAQVQASIAATKNTTAHRLLTSLLAKLSPSAKDTVTSLHNMGAAWKVIRLQTQEGLFGPIKGQMDSVRGFLPVLRTLLVQAASAIGDVIAAGIRMFTSGPFSRDFKSIATTSAGLIRTIGHALLLVVDGFRHIGMAAVPFTTSIAKGLEAGAKSFDNFAARLRSSGKLADYLTIVRDRISDWWKVLKNIGITFANIGRAAFPLTQGLTKSLVAMTQRWRDFTAVGTTGGDRLRKYFVEVQPVLHQTVLLFSAMAKGLFHVGGDTRNLNNAVKLLIQLRTELGPAIGRIFKALDFGQIGGNFVDVLTGIANGVARLLTTVGVPAFHAFWDTIKSAVGWFDKLKISGDGTGRSLGKLAGSFGALAAVLLIAKFTGLLKLVALLSKIPLLLATLRTAFAGIGGPILLIAGAIALVAAASPDLRKTLGEVFKSVLDAVKPLIPILQSIASSIGTVLTPVVWLLGTAFVGVAKAVGALLGWVTRLPGPFKAIVISIGLMTVAGLIFGRTMISSFIATRVAAIAAATGIKAAFISTGIGILLVALGTAIAFFIGQTDDVPSTAEAAKSALGDLTDTIDTQALSWGKLARAKVLANLNTQRDDGTTSIEIAQLKAYGVTAKLATDAILGLPNALNKAHDAMVANAIATAASSQTMDDLNKAAKLAGQQNTITAGVIAAAALGDAGAKKLITDATDKWNEAAGEQARLGNLTTAQLSLLDAAIETVNDDVKGADAGMDKYTQAWVALQTQAGVATQQLHDAGVAAVDNGDAVALLGDKLEKNGAQLYESYKALRTEGETIEHFVSRMGQYNLVYGEHVGVVLSAADATRALHNEQAKDPGAKNLADQNAGLAKQLTLTQQINAELQKKQQDNATSAFDPTTVYDSADKTKNPDASDLPGGAAKSAAADMTGTTHLDAAYTAQAAAEEAASKARDKAEASIQAEQDAATTAAEAIKDARIKQADAEEKAAAATVDAVNKRLAAAQREAQAAKTEVDKLIVLSTKAQDQLNTARGEVRSNQQILNDAVKNQQSAKTPGDKSYWSGIISGAQRDEADARARVKAAEEAVRKSGKNVKTGEADEAAKDKAVKARQAELDKASKVLADLTGSNAGARAKAEKDYAEAVKKAAQEADAARQVEEAKYEAILARRGAAEKAATALDAAETKKRNAIADTANNHKDVSIDDLSDQYEKAFGSDKKRSSQINQITKKYGASVANEIAKLPPDQAAKIMDQLLPKGDPTAKQKASIKRFITDLMKASPMGLELLKEARETVAAGKTIYAGLTPAIATAIIAGFQTPKKSLAAIGKQWGIQFSAGLNGAIDIKFPEDPATYWKTHTAPGLGDGSLGSGDYWKTHTAPGMAGGGVQPGVPGTGVAGTGAGKGLGPVGAGEYYGVSASRGYTGGTPTSGYAASQKYTGGTPTSGYGSTGPADEGRTARWIFPAAAGPQGLRGGSGGAFAQGPAFNFKVSPAAKTDARNSGKIVYSAFTAPFKDTKTFFDAKATLAAGGLAGFQERAKGTGTAAYKNLTDPFASTAADFAASRAAAVDAYASFPTDLTPTFTTAAANIGTAWAGVADTLAAPGSFFVDTVLNKWMIPGINTVLDAAGGKPIPKATGTPNADTRRSEGGGVPGIGNNDTVPSLLTPGEFVFRKAAVQGIGLPTLNYWNDSFKSGVGRVRKFAAGGLVGAAKNLASSEDALFLSLLKTGGGMLVRMDKSHEASLAKAIAGAIGSSSGTASSTPAKSTPAKPTPAKKPTPTPPVSHGPTPTKPGGFQHGPGAGKIGAKPGTRLGGSGVLTGPPPDPSDRPPITHGPAPHSAAKNKALLQMLGGGSMADAIDKAHERAVANALAHAMHHGPAGKHVIKTDSHDNSTVIQHLEINHPKPEPAKESLVRGLRKVAYVTRVS